MIESRVGRALMGLGVSVGVIAVSLVFIEARVNLPDWLVRIAMIKLMLVSAGGFLAVGALISRYARQRALLSSGEPKYVGEGPAETINQERQGVERPGRWS